MTSRGMPPSEEAVKDLPMRCSLVLLALTLALAAGTPSRAQLTRVSVVGDAPANGIFDPSVEFAPGSADGWLAYSAVFGGLDPFGPHVETHLARSLDAGVSWTFERVINTSFSDTLDLSGSSGGTLPGVWNYEVSSLVHDGSDPDASRRWKLFAHRVFRKTEDNFTEEQNQPAYSWIVFRTAPHPTGPWSPEIALFSSGPLPPPPYDSVQVAVSALHPSLGSLLVYSEPGTLVSGGVLYVSLTGLTAAGPDRIVLLSSADHGASWQYAGTPLTNTDAALLGYESFDGSALVEHGGRSFLLVTPNNPGLEHDGTMVIPFESLAAGDVEREAGVPRVEKHLPAIPGFPTERRGGQADFDPGAAGVGIFQPALHVEHLPELFRFYSTGQVPAAGPVPAIPPAGAGALALLVAITARRRWRHSRSGPVPGAAE